MSSSDVPLPSSFDDNASFYEESRLQKLIRRLREEPLVPLGCALTVWALLGATRSIRHGNHHEANRMFRRRIYAQGFTLVAMVGGSIYWKADREKRKEFEGLLGERKRKEKHEAWLRELEARDEEDRAFRRRMERERQRGRERRREEEEARAAQEEVRSVMEEGEGRGVLAAVRDTVEKRK